MRDSSIYGYAHNLDIQGPFEVFVILTAGANIAMMLSSIQLGCLCIFSI